MRSRGQALLLLHVAVLLFGGSGLLGKVVAVPALTITCVRSFVAGLSLFAVTYWFKQQQTQGFLAAFRQNLVPGVLLAFHWWTFFESIQRSSVALGLLTFASYPLFGVVLGWIWLREALRWADILGCVLVVSGLLFIVPEWGVVTQGGRAGVFGLASGASFALLTAVNRALRGSHPALLLVRFQTLIAGICLLPFAGTQLPSITLVDWAWLMFLALLFTAVAHFCFVASLSHVSVSVASITSALEPVYGILLACLFLNERPSFAMVIGATLLLGAALLVSLHKAKTPPGS